MKINVKQNMWWAYGALCGLAFALPVHAASFDCAKASTKVEHIICDNLDISKLDDQLAEKYKEALKDKTRAKEIWRTQREWLKERNRCADISCLNKSYQQRITQLKNMQRGFVGANGGNTNPRLTAGWDFKLEGGGGGTEPYAPGSDDELCQKVKAYMNRVAPNWKPYKEDSSYMENYCTTAVQLFPGFSEPPWADLDPRKHEELIAKLLRYRIEGAREYFGYAEPAPNRKSDSYYREEARHFIESGGRLQYWKTRLIDYYQDIKEGYKRWPPGDQNVIQLRFAEDYSNDKRFQNLPCHLPKWGGAVFIVTDDLTGPDPRKSDGGGSGALSNATLYLYKNKPVLLSDDGFEINIQEYREEFLPACTLIYPYYKFR